MRTWASRHNDQLGNADDRLDRHSDGWWRVDHSELEALLAQDLKIVGKTCDCSLSKSGIFRLTLVPPIGQRSLWVDIDKYNWSSARALRLYGKVP